MELQLHCHRGDGSAGADDKIAGMVKELEFKVKIVEKERADLSKTATKELDSIQPEDYPSAHSCGKHLTGISSYEDVGKASQLLKRIRKFKNQVNEADQKLKDLEEV